MSLAAAVWCGRAAWVGIVAMVVVFVASASVNGTTPDLAIYGGLSACFACNNGWNWHVLLFTLAFPVAMWESLLAFRAPVLPSSSRAARKWVHLALQTAALVLSVLGLVSIVRAKQFTYSKIMYSVHSWCGAVTLFLFGVQYLVGVPVFVLFRSRIAPATLALLARVHVFLGKLTFFFGMETCVNGWADMQMMMVHSGQPYYKSATMLGSASALLYFVQAAAAMWFLWPAQELSASKEVDKEEVDKEEVDI